MACKECRFFVGIEFHVSSEEPCGALPEGKVSSY